MTQRAPIPSTPRDSLSTTTQAATSSSWKEHPIVVAAIAVSGTIALAVLLIKEVIIPTHTAALTNKISSLSAEVSSLHQDKENSSKTIYTLKEKISTFERELSSDKQKYLEQIAKLEEKLTQAQLANLFSFGNPYPSGLGLVRVGDSIQKVLMTYPEDVIGKDNDGYYTIKDQHKIFNHIVYYYDKKDPNNKISHISFSVRYPYSINDTLLQEKLVETLGTPKEWSRKGYYSWDTGAGAGATVFKDDKYGYILMSHDYFPGYWPDE